MKKSLFVLIFIFLSSVYVQAYHLFFISQKQAFVIDGVEYSAWVVNSGGKYYFFMESTDPRPLGYFVIDGVEYKVYDIEELLASQGGTDLIRIETNKYSVFRAGTLATEFAGGSDTTIDSAWLCFFILSVFDKAAHEPLPTALAAKIAIKVKWSGGSGKLQDWIDAGYPTEAFRANVGGSGGGIFHLFFIDQKELVSGYETWVISSGGTDYYFMEHHDTRPPGANVRNIVAVVASAGGKDLLYYITRNSAVAIAGSLAIEYAGGSDTSTASAWLTFAILSYFGKAAHASIPIGTAAKITIPVRWRSGGVMQSGNVNDWVAAGYPLDSIHIDVGVRVFGVD